MKTVILAGGLGTRLSEYTENIPKPMVRVCGKPLLEHIINIYSEYQYNEFIIALGYKGEEIKRYFMEFKFLNSDISINIKNGERKLLNAINNNWNISMIDTGLDSMTGGRLKRLGKYINDERFFLTYGDGIGNVNIDNLLDFHISHGKMVTVTAVRPVARFGEITMDGNFVKVFKEKPQVDQGWINGGFFVIEPEFLNLIDNDSTVLEKDPIEKACAMGELMAYKHYGIWQCVDTKRDVESINTLFNKGKL